ncbi:MAG: PD-(D/E)XK nuclease family protein, partial [Gammaproteobacteria bacterium]
MQTVWLAQGPVRAAQWGLYLAQPEVVWVEQWRTWLPEFAARATRTGLLSSRQTLALWQRAISTSDTGPGLLDVTSVARWANEAWSLLRQYRVADPWAAGGGSDLRRLLEWGSNVEHTLESHGWHTRDDVFVALEQLDVDGALQRKPQHLVLHDVTDITPLEQACLDLLTRAGWRIEYRRLPQIEARVRLCRAKEPAEELSFALEWLLARLEANPEQRVALVVPAGSSAESAVRRRCAHRSDVGFARGRAPLEFPPVAAALRAVQMLGSSGNADDLSAWLRSPFMHGFTPEDQGNAVRCEIAERESLVAQLPLRRQRDALFRRLSERAPEAADRLARAFALGERIGSVASPVLWTALWREQLEALGWMRDWPSGERDRAVQMLEQGFDAAVVLTPILGTIDSQRALAELRTALGQPLIGSRFPVTGLHVLNDVDDVGPGYAAAWVTGMTHSAWPQRSGANPLLPRALQADLQMPWASAEYSRMRAERSIRRLAAGVPELIFSWPAVSDGEETGSAAVLSPWLADRVPWRTESTHNGGLQSYRERLDPVDDSIEPLGSDCRLHGGATLLNFQASCPLRAFIDFRLQARELPRRSRGVSRALRGQILHRAAAGLLQAGTHSASLQTDANVDWAKRVAAAAQRAVNQEFRNTYGWFDELIRFERRRVELALSRLLELESARSAFSVEAVEREVRFVGNGVSLKARVDRMDRLASGDFAIIDYKTGATGT